MLLIQSKRNLAGAVFFACAISAQSFAQSGKPGMAPGAPPPEAIKACAQLSEGEACSFAGRGDDVVSGSCLISPRQESLVCVPSDARFGGQGRPE